MPLLVEAMLLALSGYAGGLLLAYLFSRRRRNS